MPPVRYCEMLLLVLVVHLARVPPGVLAPDCEGGSASSAQAAMSVDELLGVKVGLPYPAVCRANDSLHFQSNGGRGDVEQQRAPLCVRVLYMCVCALYVRVLNVRVLTTMSVPPVHCVCAGYVLDMCVRCGG
jgi:hypothetical protein